MTDKAEQAVAEGADAQPDAGTEAVGAQAEATPSLDDILDSVSGERRPQSEPSQQTAQQSNDLEKTVASLQAEVAELRKAREGESFEREFDETAGRLAEGLDVDLNHFKDALYGRVARDPRLVDVFDKRHEDPAKWKEVEKALKAEYAGRFPAKSENGNVDDDLTATREAVAATVRGETSTRSRGSQQYTAEEVANMTDEQFAEAQRKAGVSPW